jgi:hypothetical protein
VSPRFLEGLPWPEGDPAALRGIAAHATRLAGELEQHRTSVFTLQPLDWLGPASDSYAIWVAAGGHALASGASAMRQASSALLVLAGAVQDGQQTVATAARHLKDARDAAATAATHAASLRSDAEQETTIDKLLLGPLLADGATIPQSPAQLAATQAEKAASDAQAHVLDVQATSQHQAQGAYGDVQRADRTCATTLEALQLVRVLGPTMPGGGPPSPALAALSSVLLGAAAGGDTSLLALLTKPPPPPPPPPKTTKKHHSGWKIFAAGGLAVLTAGLTVVNVLQLGADPLTDAAEVETGGETIALTGEAIEGETVETTGEVAAAGDTPAAAAGAGGEAGTPLEGAESAQIDPSKLQDYALNPEHAVGGNKARVFESALGYTRSNYEGLLEQIKSGVARAPAVAGKLDEYGQRFTVDIEVTGPKGTAVVRTGWIVKPGSPNPSLTTLFVK